jgi:hypothetical protein
VVAKHKTEALRRASQQKDTLYSSIGEQSKALRDLVSRNDFFPNPSFSLDTPFLIGSIPLIGISDSAAVPFGSWRNSTFRPPSQAPRRWASTSSGRIRTKTMR